jgi:uncharacterized membrane protein
MKKETSVMFIWPSLVVPFITLVCGCIFYKFPPKDVNSFSGYRTARFRKNAQTWKEANRYAAKLSILFSIIGMVLAAGISLLLGNNDAGTGMSVILSPLIIIVLFILVIVFTERHLKEKFGD